MTRKAKPVLPPHLQPEQAPKCCKGCMQLVEDCKCEPDAARKLGRFERETDDGIEREELNFDD